MNSSSKKCDIIIPVYNGLSYVKDCLASIVCFTPASLYRMYLIDDASDEVTGQYLEQFAEAHPNISVCRHLVNLGFVKSCNSGLQRATGPFAVIVNTDVVVAPQWLERLLACMEQDVSIGLVNPLTNYASQIAVPMPAGFNFMDVDRLLGRRFHGQMADVVTGVGFCMLLRCKTLAEVGVFDEIYGRGYCEESDLCMRMTTRGWRTVVAKDVYLYHKGQASFKSREQHYQNNRRIFDSRWASEYHRQFSRFQKSDPLGEVRRYLRFFPRKWDPKPAGVETARGMIQAFKARDVVNIGRAAVGGVRRMSNARRDLVTPQCLKAYKPAGFTVTYVMRDLLIAGGVLSVIQLVNELILAGVDARIVALYQDPLLVDWTKLYVQPIIYRSPRELLNNLPESDVLVATLWITAEWVYKALQNGRAKAGVYFLQDYEPWFFPEKDRSGRRRVEKTYSFFKHHIVKSQWLETMMAKHGVAPQKIALGLDLGTFYPRNLEHKYPVVLAMARPRTPRRGFYHVIAALDRVKKARPDTQIVLFGDRFLSKYDIPFEYTDAGIVSDQSRLAELYAGADVFLDGSDFQGFGRCALEAMACGTACVLTNVGGVREYAIDTLNCLLVAPGEPEAFADAIIKLLENRQLRQGLVQEGIATAAQFCHKKEAAETREFFLKIAHQ